MNLYHYYLIFILLLFSVLQVEAATSCQKFHGITGAEDINIDKEQRYAYLSSQNRYANPKPAGAIYRLSLKNMVLEKMHYSTPFPFHPHGIALYQEGKKNYLYVVNHRKDNVHAIEIFLIKGNHLIHKQSLYHSALKDPNDLHVIKKNQFYVTNFSQNNVLFFNNHRWSIATSNIPYANGINGLNKNQFIYVASSLLRQVIEYRADTKTGELIKNRAFSVHMYGDNIEKDKNGHLWIAGHLTVPSFLMHSRFANIASPSQIVTFKPSPDSPKPTSSFVHTIIKDNGRYLSSASVAAPFKNYLLIGTVFEPYILKCKI